MNPTRNDQTDRSPDMQAGHGPARRPWFGPKRFGIGYRPQTWQGLVVAAVIACIAIVITRFAHGHAAEFLLPLLVLIVPVRILMSRRRQ